MKKLHHLGLSILMSALLASCGGTSGGTTDEFTPSLNKDTDCAIKVVGDYSNFEALEAEFDKFNVYYPNVRLSYTKIDKYEDNLPTVLAGSEKPNIFFSPFWKYRVCPGPFSRSTVLRKKKLRMIN